MSLLIKDLEKCGFVAPEPEKKMTQEEEIEMLLKRALRDCKLGYMAQTSNSIEMALKIFIKLGDKDE